MVGDFFLTNWILEGMLWVFENIAGGSVFLTIVICTIIIRGISAIGDVKSRKSSIKMQAIQPEIQKLQKKYANDPRKMQAAQQKLMKDRGVSMWGSCLPVLIMMPLFFCFIAAFRYWASEQMIRVLLELNETGSSQLFESFKWLWINNVWQPDSGVQPVVQTAETFLATQKLDQLIYFQKNPEALAAFRELGLIVTDVKNIPQSAIDTYNRLIQPLMVQYEGYNNGWFILPILAGGTSFLSGKLMQAKQPQQAQNANQPGAGANKAMIYIFPAMSVFFCLTANAAFAVYWCISNVVSIAVNLAINKALQKKAEENSTEVR